MIRSSALMLVLALASAPSALAQQGTFGMETSTDRGAGGARSNEHGRGRTMEQERSGSQTLSVSAASIILPSFATLRGRGFKSPWIDVCQLADKSTDRKFLLDQLESMQKEFFNGWDKWASIEIEGKRKDAEALKAGSPLENLAGSFLGKSLPSEHGDAKKKRLEAIERDLQIDIKKINDEVQSVKSLSNAQKAENISYIKRATEEEAALDCIELAASYVSGNQSYWPEGTMFNFSEMAKHARHVVAANIVLHNLGAKIAPRLKLIEYKDHEVATAAAAEIAKRFAFETSKNISDMKSNFSEIKIMINADGKCGACFSATLPNGQAFGFEGTMAGWIITVAGGQWGGNGWLAGSRIDIAFNERGVATVSQVEEAIQRSEMTWSQRIGTSLGFGK